MIILCNGYLTLHYYPWYVPLIYAFKLFPSQSLLVYLFVLYQMMQVSHTKDSIHSYSEFVPRPVDAGKAGIAKPVVSLSRPP